MHSPPPDWSASRPTSHDEPLFNGQSLQIGQSLGLLVAHSHQQIRVLERISDRLDGLPDEIAGAMPRPAAPAPIPQSAQLSLKDKVYLVLAVVIVLAALLGHEAAQTMLANVKL